MSLINKDDNAAWWDTSEGKVYQQIKKGKYYWSSMYQLPTFTKQVGIELTLAEKAILMLKGEIG